MRGGAIALALLVCAALCGSARAATNKIYKVSTPHYEIQTTVNEEFTYLLANHMEAIYREYSTRLSNLFGGKGTKKFQVFVFKTEEEYLAALGPYVKGSAGIFVPQRQLLAGWLGDRMPPQLFRVLYHEGFHQFVYFYISKRCPIWLNEGMAEYFSEATWIGKRFRIGEVSPVRLAILKTAIEKDRYLPLARIVTMTPEEWGQNVRSSPNDAMLEYNEAWSLVHFLIHGDRGRHRARFVRFVKLIQDGKENDKAFAACFGSNFKSLETAWKRYVLSLEPSEKFVCEMHVKALCYIVKNELERGQKVKNIDQLYRQLRSSDWRLTMDDGSTLVNRGGKGVAELFHCPEHKGRGGSYELKTSKETDLPEITCSHHPGMTIVGRVVKDAQWGAFKVVVFEDIPTKSGPKPSR